MLNDLVFLQYINITIHSGPGAIHMCLCAHLLKAEEISVLYLLTVQRIMADVIMSNFICLCSNKVMTGKYVFLMNKWN